MIIRNLEKQLLFEKYNYIMDTYIDKSFSFVSELATNLLSSFVITD